MPEAGAEDMDRVILKVYFSRVSTWPATWAAKTLRGGQLDVLSPGIFSTSLENPPRTAPVSQRPMLVGEEGRRGGEVHHRSRLLRPPSPKSAMRLYPTWEEDDRR